MTLRPITFNAQYPEGTWPVLGFGFDWGGHEFCIHPHPTLAHYLIVSHVDCGFKMMQMHTDDQHEIMEEAKHRLNHVGLLQLDRAIASAKAMNPPRNVAPA